MLGSAPVRLLITLFTSATALRNFVVSHIEGGHDIVTSMPSAEHSPLQAYAQELISQLVQRGQLDGAHFFDRLRVVYPNRAKDIRSVAYQVERRALGSWLAQDMSSEFARADVGKLAFVLGVSTSSVLERCIPAEPTVRIQTLFVDRWPTREELGDWTIDKANELNFVADCADLLGTPLQAFEVGTSEHVGSKTLRQAFPTKFVATTLPPSPVPSPVPIAPRLSGDSSLDRDLGSLTAKEARQRGLAPAIAHVIGADQGEVERLMTNAHGRNYIRNLFWDHWPEDDRFGDFTVAEVKKHHLLGTIAAILGCSYRDTVDRICNLGSSPDVLSTPLRAALRDIWPVFEDDEDAPILEVSDFHLERISAGDVLNSSYRDDFIETIAFVTRIRRTSSIMKLLAAFPPKTLVAQVLADRWPSSEEWLELSVSNVRRYALVATIANRFGLDTEVLRQRLEDEHGNTLLSRVIRVSRGPGEDSVSLGDLTLADVDRRELRGTLIAFLEGHGVLQQRGVTRRFNSTKGNALVRNVFNEVDRKDWPDV